MVAEGRRSKQEPRRATAIAVSGGQGQAGRPLRVHPVRLLLHFVPVLLVERRPLPGTCRTHAGT